jgi:hypothetical protein
MKTANFVAALVFGVGMEVQSPPPLALEGDPVIPAPRRVSLAVGK